MPRYLIKIGKIHIHHTYYLNELKFNEFYKFIIHCQTGLTRAKFGFIRRRYKTLVNSLVESNTNIFSRFLPNYRNEIRKSEKEGVIIEFTNDFEWYLNYHNEFSISKGLPTLRKELLDAYQDDLVVSLAKYGDIILCAHVHQIYPDLGVVRLLFSSSYRFKVAGNSQLVGRANKWLHWKDMQNFKEMGLAFYDFGGYSGSVLDPNKIGIDKFKKGFGGAEVDSFEYISVFYYFFSIVYYFMRRAVNVIVKL